MNDTNANPFPEQTFFEDPAIDRLMGVTMALAAEVYVLRERLRALEGAAGDDAMPREDAAAFAERILSPLRGEQQSKGPQ